MYFGMVTNRSDPRKIGRVKIRVPSVVDETSWAFPIGLKSGPDGDGEIDPPALKATVLMGFEAANIDRPFYFYGPPAIGNAPPLHDVTETTQNAVFVDDTIIIERDTRPGSSGYRVRDRADDPADHGKKLTFELDLETRQVQLTSTLGILIKTTGALRLEGATILINTRVVKPVGKPI